MDYHLDRRVILSEESEFSSLYKWSLQEVNADGNKLGSDQIPWAWSLYFTAHQLAFSDALAIDADSQKDGELREIRVPRTDITCKDTPLA